MPKPLSFKAEKSGDASCVMAKCGGFALCSPGEIPGMAPVPVAGSGVLDKVEMILAVVAFLITIGCVVVLAIMKVE